METFITWLEEELKKRAWRPADLARQGAIDTGSVSRILNGTRRPGPENCVAIAKALNYSPEVVFRQAGLLPSGPEPDLQVEEATQLFQKLSPAQREFVLQALRAWGEEE